MPHWSVKGSFLARRDYWQPFAKQCTASTAEQAKEWTLSEIGGCHGVPRSRIRIDGVSEVAP